MESTPTTQIICQRISYALRFHFSSECTHLQNTDDRKGLRLTLLAEVLLQDTTWRQSSSACTAAEDLNLYLFLAFWLPQGPVHCHPAGQLPHAASQTLTSQEYGLQAVWVAWFVRLQQTTFEFLSNIHFPTIFAPVIFSVIQKKRNPPIQLKDVMK